MQKILLTILVIYLSMNAMENLIDDSIFGEKTKVQDLPSENVEKGSLHDSSSVPKEDWLNNFQQSITNTFADDQNIHEQQSNVFDDDSSHGLRAQDEDVASANVVQDHLMTDAEWIQLYEMFEIVKDGSSLDNTVERENYDELEHLNLNQSEKQVIAAMLAFGENSESLLGNSKNWFICKLCPFKTRHSWSSKQHMMRHAGDKPYKCDQCSYASVEKPKLEEHKRTHSGEKPYTCDQCAHACNSVSNLMIHKRKHSKEKPYCEGFKRARRFLSN